MSISDDQSLGLELDRICDQWEEQWSAGSRPDFQIFLQQVEKPHRKKLLEMMLELDLELRLRAGHRVSAEDYQDLGHDAVAFVKTFQDTHDSRAQTTEPPKRLDEPKRIGPYRLLQQIGEGGMGSVWMAEQEQPVRRRVAVKVIRAGMDSKQVIARFEAERQALAMMDHQNIAKVLDAGMTEDGRPYFAMELVLGIPITQYCNRNKLSLKERLKLFVPVCKAIQHAHQKGIIHRDLKPSNVLVTLYDGKPVPKVIDFGLAKALQHQTKLTDKTMFTEFGQVVGTLQYMSPEQAEMDALDVDTRTDVYSLGVVLYELLIGSTPLEKQSVQQNALLDILLDIKEKDPPRPSTRLSQSGDAISGISEQRKIEPRKLKQVLRGELDWIVMKALEKDRTMRYETANGLAADVGRFLNDDPVVARPPTVGYRLRKSVRRNRIAFATVTTILAGLVLGVVGLTYGLRSASISAQRAKEMELKSREAVNDYFVIISQNRLLNQPGMQGLRKELLETALDYYEQFRAENSGDEALQREVGLAYQRVAKIRGDLGQTDTESLQRAIDIFSALPDRGTSLPLAQCHWRLGKYHHVQDEFDTAFEQYQKALDICDHRLDEAPEHVSTLVQALDCLLSMSAVKRAQNEMDKGWRRISDAETLMNSIPSDIASDPLLQHKLADVYSFMAEHTSAKESIEFDEKSIRTMERIVGQLPHDLGYKGALYDKYEALGIRLRTLYQSSDLSEAEQWLNAAIDGYTGLHAANPQVTHYRFDLAMAHDQLAFTLTQTKPQKVVEAEAHYLEAAKHWRVLADDPGAAESKRSKFWLAMVSNGLAMIYRDQSKEDKSISEFDKAISVYTDMLREDSIDKYQSELAGTYLNKGWAEFVFTRYAESSRSLQEAIDIYNRLVTDSADPKYKHWLAQCWSNLAAVLEIGLGDYAGAIDSRQACLKHATELMEEDSTSPRNVFMKKSAEFGLRRSQVLKSLALGDLSTAREDAEDLGSWIKQNQEFMTNQPTISYNMVGALATVYESVDDKEIAQFISQQAIAQLENARSAGWLSQPESVGLLRTDQDLEPLRESEEFRSFVDSIEQ